MTLLLLLLLLIDICSSDFTRPASACPSLLNCTHIRDWLQLRPAGNDEEIYRADRVFQWKPSPVDIITGRDRSVGPTGQLVRPRPASLADRGVEVSQLTQYISYVIPIELSIIIDESIL